MSNLLFTIPLIQCTSVETIEHVDNVKNAIDSVSPVSDSICGRTRVVCTFPCAVMIESIELRLQESTSTVRILSVYAKRTEDADTFRPLVENTSFNVPSGNDTDNNITSPSPQLLIPEKRNKFHACGVAKTLQLDIEGPVNKPGQNGKRKSFVETTKECVESPLETESSLQSRRRKGLPIINITIPRSESSFDFEPEWEDQLVIVIHGFYLDTIPAASYLISCLNLASILQTSANEDKKARDDALDSADADMLAGLAFYVSRNYIQASEFFHRGSETLQYVVNNLTIDLEEKIILRRRAMHYETLAADSLSKPETMCARKKTLFQIIKLYDQIQHDIDTEEKESEIEIEEKIIHHDEKKDENKEQKEEDNKDNEDNDHGICAFGDQLQKVCCESFNHDTSMLHSLEPTLTNVLLENINTSSIPVVMASLRLLKNTMTQLACNLGLSFINIFNTILNANIHLRDPLLYSSDEVIPQNNNNLIKCIVTAADRGRRLQWRRDVMMYLDNILRLLTNILPSLAPHILIDIVSIVVENVNTTVQLPVFSKPQGPASLPDTPFTPFSAGRFQDENQACLVTGLQFLGILLHLVKGDAFFSMDEERNYSLIMMLENILTAMSHPSEAVSSHAMTCWLIFSHYAAQYIGQTTNKHLLEEFISIVRMKITIPLASENKTEGNVLEKAINIQTGNTGLLLGLLTRCFTVRNRCARCGHKEEECDNHKKQNDDILMLFLNFVNNCLIPMIETNCKFPQEYKSNGDYQCLSASIVHSAYVCLKECLIFLGKYKVFVSKDIGEHIIPRLEHHPEENNSCDTLLQYLIRPMFDSTIIVCQKSTPRKNALILLVKLLDLVDCDTIMIGTLRSLLSGLLKWIPGCLQPEALIVVDKLLSLLAFDDNLPALPESIITQLTSCICDKYTIHSASFDSLETKIISLIRSRSEYVLIFLNQCTELASVRKNFKDRNVEEIIGFFVNCLSYEQDSEYAFVLEWMFSTHFPAFTSLCKKLLHHDFSVCRYYSVVLMNVVMIHMRAGKDRLEPHLEKAQLDFLEQSLITSLANFDFSFCFIALHQINQTIKNHAIAEGLLSDNPPSIESFLPLLQYMIRFFPHVSELMSTPWLVLRSYYAGMHIQWISWIGMLIRLPFEFAPNKKKVCHKFKENGHCKYRKCRYIHDEKQYETIESLMKICREMLSVSLSFCSAGDWRLRLTGIHCILGFLCKIEKDEHVQIDWLQTRGLNKLIDHIHTMVDELKYTEWHQCVKHLIHMLEDILKDDYIITEKDVNAMERLRPCFRAESVSDYPSLFQINVVSNRCHTLQIDKSDMSKMPYMFSIDAQMQQAMNAIPELWSQLYESTPFEALNNGSYFDQLELNYSQSAAIADLSSKSPGQDITQYFSLVSGVNDDKDDKDKKNRQDDDDDRDIDLAFDGLDIIQIDENDNDDNDDEFNDMESSAADVPSRFNQNRPKTAHHKRNNSIGKDASTANHHVGFHTMEQVEMNPELERMFMEEFGANNDHSFSPTEHMETAPLSSPTTPHHRSSSSHNNIKPFTPTLVRIESNDPEESDEWLNDQANLDDDDGENDDMITTEVVKIALSQASADPDAPLSRGRRGGRSGSSELKRTLTDELLGSLVQGDINSPKKKQAAFWAEEHREAYLTLLGDDDDGVPETMSNFDASTDEIQVEINEIIEEEEQGGYYDNDDAHDIKYQEPYSSSFSSTSNTSSDVLLNPLLASLERGDISRSNDTLAEYRKARAWRKQEDSGFIKDIMNQSSDLFE